MKNRLLIVFTALLITFSDAKNIESEDELIIKALYYEVNNPQEAARVWRELFKLTN
ncbi:MAG: hypothetical protein GXO02_05350, partial [Epsilonproteobacteria bacterium]|nr:hypothetical protein [Campylobacterota bacterium]